MSARLPEFLRPYFWDVDFGALDKQENQKYIINRLLDKGNIQAAKWVEENYTHEAVAQVLRTARDFSLRNASFWGMVYRVPQAEIKCFYEPYRTTRKTLWPY